MRLVDEFVHLKALEDHTRCKVKLLCIDNPALIWFCFLQIICTQNISISSTPFDFLIKSDLDELLMKFINYG